ncbi:MAG: hypothetical protein D6726_04585 [Nitrospirae bacterium]|nr:MAG: hypothetical protein D6726_04585 [Nitrospirota bacterium]
MRQDIAKKGLYAGTGAGLILFVLAGLLPGSLIGGMIGLKVAGLIFGTPLKGLVIARVIVAVSMILGVLGAAAVFIVGSSIVGWAFGVAIDAIKSGRIAEEEVPQEAKH